MTADMSQYELEKKLESLEAELFQHKEGKRILQNTINAMPHLVTVHDKNFRVLLSNWYDHDYITEEERNGFPYCYEVYMHRNKPCDPCHASDVIKSRKTKIVEHTNLVDGKTREISAFPIFSGDDSVEMVVEVVKDITERIQYETAMENAHERLLTVLDSIDAFVYVIDVKTYEILFINKVGEKIFGNVTGDICWKSMQYNQKGPCNSCPNDQVLISTHKKDCSAYVYSHQNSFNGRWYEHRDTIISWVDDRIVKLKIATDITEQKAASEEKDYLINKLNQALSEIKTLKGIIPICSKCKKIRDDEGYWHQVEQYIAEHSEAQFSHGMCRKCSDELYGGEDWYLEAIKEGEIPED